MGDTLKPIYRFEWDDQRSRRTDNMKIDPTPEQAEALAELGRQDPECNVEQVGLTT